MNEKVLIVEDQFVEADYLRLMLTQAGYQVTGIARSVTTANEMMAQQRPDLVLLDIFLKGTLTGIDLARQLREENIAFVFLSANSNEEILAAAKATQPYGFLVKPFREKDLLVTLEIARYRHEHSQEAILRRESVLEMKLAKIIAEQTTWEQKLLLVGKALQPYIPFDFIAAGFNTLADINCHAQSFLRIGYDEYQSIGSKELLTIANLGMNELMDLLYRTTTDTNPTIYNEEAFEKICAEPSLKKLFADAFKLQSHLSSPLLFSNERFFSFCFYSRRPDAYTSEHTDLLNRLDRVMARSVERMVYDGRVGEDKPEALVSAASENAAFVRGFEGIIGKSHLLLNVFDHISQVAPSDTSVLIMGESGTGKERIADCIHNLSPRKGRPFIKVNCAALPSTLIESELFGHEKGSFTGALDKRIGKFEQADKGTVFLDEIGEMPLELQVKLLRVLQEKEVERIGSRAPLKINVRIIAATNRNLEREVAEGRFRLDLYYRLNVFPLLLPPLRDRKEDIPDLATFFINKYKRKAGKTLAGLSQKSLKTLMAYDWPGNIRQLEHIIERSVLLARGSVIDDIVLPASNKKEFSIFDANQMKTIHENERDYIVKVLKSCNGRIWGPGAAAEILNIPPSTLKSKMKKLGIKKQYIE